MGAPTLGEKLSRWSELTARGPLTRNQLYKLEQLEQSVNANYDWMKSCDEVVGMGDLAPELTPAEEE